MPRWGRRTLSPTRRRGLSRQPSPRGPLDLHTFRLPRSLVQAEMEAPEETLTEFVELVRIEQALDVAQERDEEATAAHATPRFTDPRVDLAIDELVATMHRMSREKAEMGEYPPISAAIYRNAEETNLLIEATCVVCLENSQTVAFAGCGHLCLCVACSHELINRSDLTHEAQCPVCRRPSVPIVLRQP